MGRRIGPEIEFAWVRADQIERDPRYQRKIRQAWVERMRKTFRPWGIGVLILVRRRDGRLVVLDGQHRLEVVLARGEGGDELPCVIYTEVEADLEREIFRILNQDRLAFTPEELFALRVRTGNLGSEAVEETLRRHGVDSKARKAFEAVEKQAGETGLDILVRSMLPWQGWSGEVVAAVHRVLRRQVWKPSEVQAVLAATGPDRLRQEKLRQELAGKRGVDAWAAAIETGCRDMSDANRDQQAVTIGEGARKLPR